MGETTYVRDFVKMAFGEVGIDIEFRGEGVDEKGYVASCSNPVFQIESGKQIIAIDPQYFRPTEVDLLIGDPTKSKTKLGWVPNYDLAGLVKEMMASDLENVRREKMLKEVNQLSDINFDRSNNFIPRLESNIMNLNDKIYVAGHRGMVGSAILRQLRAEGFTNYVLKNSSELDLRNQQAVADFFVKEKPDYVF